MSFAFTHTPKSKNNFAKALCFPHRLGSKQKSVCQLNKHKINSTVVTCIFVTCSIQSLLKLPVLICVDTSTVLQPDCLSLLLFGKLRDHIQHLSWLCCRKLKFPTIKSTYHVDNIPVPHLFVFHLMIYCNCLKVFFAHRCMKTLYLALRCTEAHTLLYVPNLSAKTQSARNEMLCICLSACHILPHGTFEMHHIKLSLREGQLRRELECPWESVHKENATHNHQEEGLSTAKTASTSEGWYSRLLKQTKHSQWMTYAKSQRCGIFCKSGRRVCRCMQGRSRSTAPHHS